MRTRFVPGLSGFVNLDHALGVMTFKDPSLYGFFYGELQLHPGFGFQLGPVQLAASADWALAYLYTLPHTENTRRLSWTDVRLTLSAPELLRGLRHLTFSPSLGFTAPVALSQVATELTAGLRVEWVIRGFELGYFVEVGRPFYFPPSEACRLRGNCGDWPTLARLRNALLVEVRPTENLSFGVRLSLEHRWRSAATGSPRSDSLGTMLFAGFSVCRAVGITLSMSRTAPLFTAGGAGGGAGKIKVFGIDDDTTLIVSLWVRSHSALSKYWLF